MSEGYKIRDQTLPHFITATVVDWVDVFTRKSYRDVIVDCLDFCINEKAMVLYGYVIMSNPPAVRSVLKKTNVLKNHRIYSLNSKTTVPISLVISLHLNNL